MNPTTWSATVATMSSRSAVCSDAAHCAVRRSGSDAGHSPASGAREWSADVM